MEKIISETDVNTELWFTANTRIQFRIWVVFRINCTIQVCIGELSSTYSSHCQTFRRKISAITMERRCCCVLSFSFSKSAADPDHVMILLENNKRAQTINAAQVGHKLCLQKAPQERVQHDVNILSSKTKFESVLFLE